MKHTPITSPIPKKRSSICNTRKVFMAGDTTASNGAGGQAGGPLLLTTLSEELLEWSPVPLALGQQATALQSA